MKIVVIGASGTLGRAVVQELGARHTVIRAGRKGPDIRVDIEDPDSIQALYAQIGPVDAVACAAGSVHFAPLADMTEGHYQIGLRNKLMGQVNLVLKGKDALADRGSFTLISGILVDQPIIQGSSASMVNGAIDAFVKAAAVEMPRGLRINSVCPSVFIESMDSYGPFFRGFEAVPVARAALAYARSIEGAQTGQVYKIY